MDSQPRLSTAQAASRLGIKPATLYAYVSRGLISSEPAVDASGSTFDALDVEALARSRSNASRSSGVKSGAPRPATATGVPLMVLDAPFALLSDEALYYRGLSADRLAREYSFEQIAVWLWGDGPAPSADPVLFRATAAGARAATAAGRLLGPGARGIDFMLQALLSAASHDPLKRDLRDRSTAALGGDLIAQLVAALPGGRSSRAGIAESLWRKLTGRESRPVELRLATMALVLSVDHDLAASTFAGRVAASAGAHPYAAMISALAAADSSRHGSASVAAWEMLCAVHSGQSPEQAISHELSRGNGIPGFGHRIYRRQDPRAKALLTALQQAPEYRPALKAAAALIAVVHSRTNYPANIDLALAVLMLGSGMREDAGQTLFTVARSAGWLAHIMGEYRQKPLRLRPIGEYTGPMPA
ncbi:citrate/2-methylcitrate synthase [Arthrobacter russicus]|jgi:citrate synthase|uniref:citrate synthase (unknown stereospecificity) n=1 Tax=Arthrobacter russicus TaxID=172040 RepID=A0ABU1JBJ6_9MICC|nr:citrate/2-methylcitrate synthase [Arthrobacter russicus]MDR6269790.1 citrate synthase [Arthrobacter russicus]